MTADEIYLALTTTHYSANDLEKITKGLIYARGRAAREMKRAIHVGDPVSFSNRGTIMQGNVSKIKTKNASVRVGYQTWNVPISMLELIS